MDASTPTTCNPMSAMPGVCVDPTDVEPKGLPPMPINCNRHQAPSGYRYVDYNGVCVLMNLRSGQPVVSQPGRGVILTDPVASVTNTVTATASGITNWIKNNPIQAAVIAALGYWFATKKR